MDALGYAVLAYSRARRRPVKAGDGEAGTLLRITGMFDGEEELRRMRVHCE